MAFVTSVGSLGDNESCGGLSFCIPRLINGAVLSPKPSLSIVVPVNLTIGVSNRLLVVFSATLSLRTMSKYKREIY